MIYETYTPSEPEKAFMPVSKGNLYWIVLITIEPKCLLQSLLRPPLPCYAHWKKTGIRKAKWMQLQCPGGAGGGALCLPNGRTTPKSKHKHPASPENWSYKIKVVPTYIIVTWIWQRNSQVRSRVTFCLMSFSKVTCYWTWSQRNKSYTKIAVKDNKTNGIL